MKQMLDDHEGKPTLGKERSRMEGTLNSDSDDLGESF
jgi:hypothetical protein